MSSRCKVMCGCEYCIFAKSIHSSLISLRDWYLKKLKEISKILKTEGLGENQISYMKHIKIQSCHMGVIFIPKHLICQRQTFVHIHIQIMHYHTVNVSCNVVPNFQELILLTSKQIINITTLVNQFVFKFIILLHVVQHM